MSCNLVIRDMLWQQGLQEYVPYLIGLFSYSVDPCKVASLPSMTASRTQTYANIQTTKFCKVIG